MKEFPMRRLILALALVLVLAPAAWCGELIVSAAASLAESFQDLKPLFEKANPDAVVTFNFAASGRLLPQMAQGAPVYVFASADQKTLDDAVSKDLIDTATRVTFAKNDLVIATPAGAPAVKSLAESGRDARQAAPVRETPLQPVGRRQDLKPLRAGPQAAADRPPGTAAAVQLPGGGRGD
jgi:molybdate transport system substrate-binding protein